MPMPNSVWQPAGGLQLSQGLCCLTVVYWAQSARPEGKLFRGRAQCRSFVVEDNALKSKAAQPKIAKS